MQIQGSSVYLLTLIMSWDQAHPLRTLFIIIIIIIMPWSEHSLGLNTAFVVRLIDDIRILAAAADGKSSWQLMWHAFHWHRRDHQLSTGNNQFEIPTVNKNAHSLSRGIIKYSITRIKPTHLYMRRAKHLLHCSVNMLKLRRHRRRAHKLQAWHKIPTNPRRPCMSTHTICPLEMMAGGIQTDPGGTMHNMLSWTTS